MCPSKGSFISDIIEFKEPGRVVVNGIGKPKLLELPLEVAEWLRSSYAARVVLRELVTHYKFRQRLAHPGAIRSLILLLYARAHGEAPYRVAKRYQVAPEQLYRLERGIKDDELQDYVMNALLLERQEEQQT